MRKKGCEADHRVLTPSLFSRRIIESEKEVIASIMSRRSAQGRNNILLRWYLTIFC